MTLARITATRSASSSQRSHQGKLNGVAAAATSATDTFEDEPLILAGAMGGVVSGVILVGLGSRSTGLVVEG